MTLNTAHSVGLSGITICIGIQNGGLAVELQKKINANEQCRKIILNIIRIVCLSTSVKTLNRLIPSLNLPSLITCSLISQH